MKSFVKLTGPLLVLSAVGACAAQYHAVAVASEHEQNAQAESQAPVVQTSQVEVWDLGAINASLRTALEEFSSRNDTIERLSYSLNSEETDINADRFAFDVELALAKTPWSDQRLDATGHLILSTNLADKSERGFTLSVQGAVEHADILAMLKYRMKRLSACDRERTIDGAAGMLWKRHCAHMAETLEVTTIEALYEHLSEKFASHRTEVATYLQTLKAELADRDTVQQVADEDVVAELLRVHIARAESLQAFLNNVELTRTETGFALSLPAFDECPYLGSTGFRIDVTQESANLAGDLHIKMGKSLYAASRPMLHEILRGLESGDATAMKLVQMDAQKFAGWLALQMDSDEAVALALSK